MRNQVEIKISLDELHAFDEGDGPGTAEPYLWTVFFKIDGETMSLGKDGLLHGQPVVYRNHWGDHGNLFDTDVDAGDTVRIPATVGYWATTLKPIPMAESQVKQAIKAARGWDDIFATVGVAWVLMEEDNLPGNAVFAGYDAFASTFQTELNRAVNQLGVVRQDLSDADEEAITRAVSAASKKAIVDHLDVISAAWLWIVGPDQTLGSGNFRCNQDSLMAQSGRIDFKLRWKDGVNVQDPFGGGDALLKFLEAGTGRFVESAGDWELRGHVEGVEVPPPKTYKVDCVQAQIRDGHAYRIFGLGVHDEAGRSRRFSKGEVIQMLGAGDRFYTEDSEGRRAWVAVYEPLPTEPQNYRHLYTTSDGVEGNNLKSLPLCSGA